MNGRHENYNRLVHVVFGLIALFCASTALYLWTDLRKDAATAFGTVSGFATLYGVVFAIIEVMYTKGAAEQAAAEARDAAKAARGVYELRNISECLSAIENILDQIQNDEAASTTLISRVIKMYSSEFAYQIDDSASLFRTNLDVVESYKFSLQPRGRNAQHATLRKALMSMTSQLSSTSSRKLGV